MTTVNCSNEKTVTAKTSGVHRKDPNGLVGESDDDVLKLSCIHEPGAIEKLSSGYHMNEIFTYIGQVLVAANPFQRMPRLYNVERMEEYRVGKLNPHPYAVADRAYRLLLSEGRSQSILVSGISGSGKTRVAELVIRYVEYVGGQETLKGRDVEKKLLQHNTILEAFGSAKTITNDNSSRFGKFVEVQFDQKGKISGAFIRTYCLERSRVTHISDQERNYHCFYMLCAAPPQEIERYELAEPVTFQYLNQSNCFEIEGVVDSESYDKMIKAMDTAGISSKEQNAIFRIVVAILHLGNVEFAAGNDECPLKIKDEKSRFHLTTTANFLMCEEKELEHSLYVTSEDRAVKYLGINAANGRRDELAQILYSRLFDWLVNKINRSMGQDPKSKCFIGVHDEFVRNHTGFTDNQEVINLVEKVTYQAQFFMDNNKVSIVMEQRILLGASKCSIVAELFPHLSSESLKSLPVDSTVKSQSQSLLDTMSATGAHYIRCVRPNSESTAGTFDNEYVLLQLRYGLTSVNNEVKTLHRDSEILKTNLNKAKEEAKLLFEKNRTPDKAKERLPTLPDKEQKHRYERKHSASNSTKHICDGIIHQTLSTDTVLDIPSLGRTEGENQGPSTTATTTNKNNNNNNSLNDQESSEDEEPTELDPKDKALFNFLKPVSYVACGVINPFNFGSFALVGSAGYPMISKSRKDCILGGSAAFMLFSVITVGVVHSVEGRAGDIDLATTMVIAEIAYAFFALCLDLCSSPRLLGLSYYWVW